MCMQLYLSVSGQNVTHVDGPSRRMCSRRFQGKEILKLAKLFPYRAASGGNAEGRHTRGAAKASSHPVAALTLATKSPTNKRRWRGVRRRDGLRAYRSEQMGVELVRGRSTGALPERSCLTVHD